MTIKALYPTARPTLNLDFANTKALDPRVTFTRASTATFVGSNGLIQTAASGAARFDHNPETGESLGLLVEEARTNLVLRSEEFDNATWAKGNLTVTANATTAPDGTLTADKLVENTANAERNVNIVATFTGSVVYTFSVFAKAAERSKFQIYLYSASPGGANFDLATGTTPQASLGASMVQYPNGWYKCSVTFVRSSSGVSGVAILPAVLFSPLAYQGDGASGLFVWGAQLEAGAFPTSYIPTAGSTVTRAADLASMTGTNFSSWFNATAGTLSVRHSLPVVYSNNATVLTIKGDPVNTLYMRANNSEHFTVLSAGAVSAQATGGANYAANTANSVAGGYALNNFRVSTNGSISSLDASGISLDAATASMTQMGLGSALGNPGTSDTTLTIARLTYYPVRLPDAQLQALTR